MATTALQWRHHAPPRTGDWPARGAPFPTDLLVNASSESLQSRWEALPPNVRGALWILLASLFLSAMAATLKAIGQFMSIWQLLLLRSVLALVLLVPALAAGRFRAVRTRRPLSHFTRAMMGTLGFSLFFLTVSHIELTLAVTLGFTRNLFLVVLAAVFLGEVIRLPRTAATVVGFIGVVICVQPTADTFEPWTFGALAFALVTAGVTVAVKKLAETEAPLTIMFYTYVYMGAAALVPALFVWQTPSWHELMLVLLVALFSTLGQTCMVHGLRAGEATAVAPFEYTRILYAFGLGYVLFGEIPDPATWLGGAIIIASTLYIAYRARRA